MPINNIDFSILRLSGTINESLHNTLNLCCFFSDSYRSELSKYPFMINLLDDALRSERLKETAHSRILYRILQDKNMQKMFVKHFLPNVDCSFESIQIPYPDKHRIDLTIKSDKFFLIIENKINNAPEQTNQINNYVEVAQKTYTDEQIYVLYLGGETNICPSEKSLSADVRYQLGDKLILKNYKDDIAPWIASVYEQIDFNVQPFLKSTLLSYKTYLENKYKLNKMNNKLDKALIERLGLNSMSIAEKINVIEDQINNIDKIRERLSSLLDAYYEQNIIQDINEWYKCCSDILSDKIVLTMENNMEFGFNFRYHNRDFRCCVSFDDGNENPYWGICGKDENINSSPIIFKSLMKLVLQSNKGFHNCEDNSEEWVVSDYEMKELIVDRFITLAQLICDSEMCTILE